MQCAILRFRKREAMLLMCGMFSSCAVHTAGTFFFTYVVSRTHSAYLFACSAWSKSEYCTLELPWRLPAGSHHARMKTEEMDMRKGRKVLLNTGERNRLLLPLS
jgi:hypothetical protein